MKARAARLVAHGKPLVVEETEIGEAGPGEVVVELAYGGVNPVDRYQAIGRVAGELPLPRTLGSEATGYVGGDAARPVFCGRRCVARPDAGVWADRVIAREDGLVPLPGGVDLRAAAALGVVGVTVWRCVVDLGEVGPGTTVLVLGATGGVGSAAVSLAHHRGATVVAQTGSPDKVEFLTGLGADRVVVADAGSLVTALDRTAPEVVLDPLGGGFTGAAVEALAPRGRIVLFGTSADVSGTVPLQMLYRKGGRILGYAGLIEPPERLAEAEQLALAALGSGEMEVAIDAVLPLGDVNVAFERIVARSLRGKQLLDLRR